ncbi:hypothetical protein FF2_029612 [Malus domestica]
MPRLPSTHVETSRTIVACHEIQKWTEDGQFCHEASGCLKLPGVDLSSRVIQRGQGWLGFAPVMMGYKDQVVASTIALPIRQKIEKGGQSIVHFR